MTPKRDKYILVLKIALSAAVLIFSAEGAVLFNRGNDWGIICLIFASAAFATLLFITDYMHAGLLCLASLIGAAVFSRDIIAVLWSGAYIPAGWIIFAGIRKKMTRTAVIVRIAVFLGVFYAALIIGSLALENGGVSPEMVSQMAGAEIEAIVENFQDLIPVNIAEADEELRAQQTELAKQQLVMNLRMMIPMFFVLYCLIIAYLASALFRTMYNLLWGVRMKQTLKRKDWRVNLSVISAVIMILCAILNLLLDRHNLLPWIIISNIQFILTPGFCVMGVYFLFDKIYDRYNKSRDVKSRFMPMLIMFFAGGGVILILPDTMGFAILTVFGLYAALIGDIKKFYDKTKKLVFGDDDDDDF